MKLWRQTVPGGQQDPDTGTSEAEAVCPFSRRNLLMGAAAGLAVVPQLGQAAAAAPAAAVQAPAAVPAAAQPARTLAGGRGHGVGNPRGSAVAVKVKRTAQGKYGLMFPSLKPFEPDDALLASLAEKMVDPTLPLDDVSLSNDGFDNPEIPAGYTYLGQFMDHDMTLDTTPLANQQSDPHALVNFDTPFFDLACVYGRGPAADPQLYDPAKPGRMLIGRTAEGLADLPRDADGTAFAGDARNDENMIISQLQLAFLHLHNEFIAAGHNFATAQRLSRWHYQWVIVNDFLPKMAGQSMVSSMLTRRADGTIGVNNKFYKPGNRRRPMMPVEYSVAAYRFGHSMIRAEYEMHDAEGATLPLFGAADKDLRGSRPLRAIELADWNYFFEIPGMNPPDDRNMTRLIDTSLSFPLANLPPTVVEHIDGAILALAQRNLLRGKHLGLPAGQDVARAMGVPPIPNSRLGLYESGWKDKAPLWFYILKEAELQGGRRLGPVGGRIICEVILGLLALDPNSYLNAKKWTPGPGAFTVGHLLRKAKAV